MADKRKCQTSRKRASTKKVGLSKTPSVCVCEATREVKDE